MKSSTLAHLESFLQRHSTLQPLREHLLEAARLICDAHRCDALLLVCGNGGSAADAEHIVGELAKQFKLPRRPGAEDEARLVEIAGDRAGAYLATHLQRGVRAFSLVSQTSLATAVANDTDASMIFAQQVYVYGRPGDVLLGISTSGNSSNVVQALRTARAFGLATIGLTGAPECLMDACCDLVLHAPATETYQIQELHLPLYHAICMMVEEELFGEE